MYLKNHIYQNKFTFIIFCRSSVGRRSHREVSYTDLFSLPSRGSGRMPLCTDAGCSVGGTMGGFTNRNRGAFPRWGQRSRSLAWREKWGAVWWCWCWGGGRRLLVTHAGASRWVMPTTQCCMPCSLTAWAYRALKKAAIPCCLVVVSNVSRPCKGVIATDGPSPLKR